MAAFEGPDSDDNVRVLMPNGMLWGAIVKVLSRNDSERIELKFVRPLSEDLGDSIARLKEIVGGEKRVARTGELGVLSVNEDTYVLVARLWVTRSDAMQVAFDLNRAVKESFQRREANRGDVTLLHAPSP